MSHSYSQDLQRLRDLSGRALPYLGVLGPQKRTRQLLEDAGLEGNQLRAVLRSPMGLDIGADGPEQVALATMAEIQAVINGRSGGGGGGRGWCRGGPAEEDCVVPTRWIHSRQ